MTNYYGPQPSDESPWDEIASITISDTVSPYLTGLTGFDTFTVRRWFAADDLAGARWGLSGESIRIIRRALAVSI